MQELRSFLKPQHRTCGECQACCFAIGVKEIGKPFSMRCKHQCDKGCAVYNNRPGSCGDYECMWRAGVGDEADRPDTVGFLIHLELSEGAWLEVYFTRPDNSFDSARLQVFINLVIRHLGGAISGVRFIHYNQIRNADWKINLKDYPNGGNWSKTSEDNTSWAYFGTTAQTYLYAPLRDDPKPRIALPVVDG